MSNENDRALRFYHEVLGLDYLHYGLWNAEDEVCIDNLKQAQQRYVDYLLVNYPVNAKTVLDVGCGTAEMASHFKAMGLDVEGLSPDINQQRIFHEKLSAPFHHCRFEHFRSDKRYDCILMSESAQYIPYQLLLQNAAQHLKPRGYLMICDYFILDGTNGVFAKSGHNLNKFLSAASDQHFKLIKQEDLTERVTKTLDFGKLCAEKLLTSFDIATEKFRTRHPHVTRFLSRLFRKKLSHLEEQKLLLDAEQFKKNKRYVFLLFQNTR